ncbi:MAG: hypothetical protein GC164_05030 [Phycisphaera sp.]|nr:hypothetical protein [Phycisphaera sp.]
MPDTRPDDLDQHQMSLGDHIEELRARLIHALLGVAVGACVALYFGRFIVLWLCTPLVEVQHYLGLSPQVYNTSPASGFGVYMQVSLVGGLILALPWVFYQAWRFIAVGLYQSEKKIVLLLAPLSSVMSALGIAFMYYIMLPVCLLFLLGFATRYPAPNQSSKPNIVFRLIAGSVNPFIGKKQEKDLTPDADISQLTQAPFTFPLLSEDPANPVQGQVWIKVPEGELRMRLGDHVRSVPLAAVSLVSPLIEIKEYVSFVSILALGCVVTFQVPLVLLLLGMTGFISPAAVAKYRGHCVFSFFVIGAVLTPPDPVSQLVLALPMWALFEFGLLLMRLAYRGRFTRPEEAPASDAGGPE